MAERGIAAQLRGFGPLGLVAILFIIAAAIYAEPIAAVLVLAWAWVARVPWAEIGLSRPRSWAGTFACGIAAGLLLKLLLKALVMPLLGAPAINPAYHYIAGNTAALWQMVAAVILIGGFGEEILYRGWLFERLRRLFGTSSGATVATVGFATLLFALAHIAGQGIAGAEQAAITGLVFAMMYLLTGSLWLGIVTHAAFDLTAVLIIYFDVEEAVARSVWG